LISSLQKHETLKSFK